MKGVKIKCGLLLALFTMLGLSLGVSSDTNALQYSVDKIPITFPANMYSMPGFISSLPGFSIRVSSDYDTSSLPRQYVLSSRKVDDVCKGTSYGSLPYLNYDQDYLLIKYGFAGYDLSSLPPDITVNNCLSNEPLTNYDSPSFGSLAPFVGPPTAGDLQSLLPYRFKYDGFYRTDTRNSDGLYYSNKFDLHNVFGSKGYPETIYYMTIPFGVANSSVSSTFEPGMPIEFTGEFVLDLDDPTSDFGLTDSTTFQLHTYYIDPSGHSGDSSICDWTLSRDNPNDSTSVYSLKYSCPYNLRSTIDYSYNPVYFSLEINFDYSTDNTKFFQFIFDSSFSITNNDFTPGGVFGTSVNGSDVHSAPGSSYQNDYSDSEPDYDLSLTNMFGFNFLNPFAPLFQMFGDNSQCVSIPILAGMLHADNSTYCPWFDSSVRNILTPVLSFASVMLIFGFAVRWLGSSSGNFFEDSKDETLSNINRSGWRRFKK